MSGFKGRRPRCLFRVAAGPRVGFGHLMRARALAKALGVRPVLSLRGGRDAVRAARTLGCDVARGPRSLVGLDLLVVDDPKPSERRLWVARGRRASVPSVSVQDDGVRGDADVVVNGSIGLPTPTRAGCVLGGARFYILDIRASRARSRRRALRRRKPCVLIALGGGQHVRQIANQLADAIGHASPSASVVVAAGFLGRRRPVLGRGRWLVAPRGLIRALLACDVAVVAGGVTLYEACALGVPAVGLAVVPAQRRAIRAFARRQAVVDVSGAPGSRVAIARAARAVARLLEDELTRRQVGRRARRLVDGRGAIRVADHIAALLGRRRLARAQ